MFLWERTEDKRYHVVTHDDMFTQEQTVNLVALRERLRAGRAVEFVLDKRRLAFARWLVENGRIGEEEHRSA